MIIDEQRRLAALHEYGLLDAPVGDELEAVVRVAALVADVPTATLNLIDENRQCQLTTTGFAGADSPRSESMCAVRPAELNAEQMARLQDLAGVILALFERRRQARVNGELAAELKARHEELAETYAALSVGAAGGRPALWVQAATRAVGRMQSLSSSLLSSARAGHAPCRIEPTPRGELVHLALTDLSGGIDGATVLVPDDLPVVEADPTLLRQLLQNLRGKALKYRRPDRPPRVELSAVRDGNRWRIAVADDGIGIPAADRERVFEMFTQVDPAAGKGTGVGLSACQRIVDRHGGRIFVTGTPGGGTTVQFTLPAQDRADRT